MLCSIQFIVMRNKFSPIYDRIKCNLLYIRVKPVAYL